MKRFFISKYIFIIFAIMLITAIAWAGMISQRPYGIATPKIYDHNAGAIGSYYLDIPTLTANDTFCGLTTTQSLSNKTFGATTFTSASPIILEGTTADAYETTWP